MLGDLRERRGTGRTAILCGAMSSNLLMMVLCAASITLLAIQINDMINSTAGVRVSSIVWCVGVAIIVLVELWFLCSGLKASLLRGSHRDTRANSADIPDCWTDAQSKPLLEMIARNRDSLDSPKKTNRDLASELSDALQGIMEAERRKVLRDNGAFSRFKAKLAPVAPCVLLLIACALTTLIPGIICATELVHSISGVALASKSPAAFDYLTLSLMFLVSLCCFSAIALMIKSSPGIRTPLELDSERLKAVLDEAVASELDTPAEEAINMIEARLTKETTSTSSLDVGSVLPHGSEEFARS